MARTRLSRALLLASALPLLGNAPSSNAATELEITVLGGALVTDFSITSGSGADYGEPIPAPEPAAGLLVLASLAAIGWLERARVA